MRRPLIVLVLVAVLCGAGVASAQQPTDPHAARVANQVSHEILSPYCPGKTLAMCPSPAAAEVRMKIQDMAESGMTEPQIREAIIEEHGEEFRIVEPPWTDDVGLLGLLGAGLGLAFVAVFVISRRRKDEAPEPAPEPVAAGEPPPEDYLEELRKQYKD